MLTLAASRGSAPWMASNTMAASRAERHSGPSLSIDQESAMAPWRLTRPKVGRRDEQPQRSEGETIEPRVSEPMANTTPPAAVAAAEPADEPLEPWAGFHGFLVVPPNHTSPQASAPRDS